MGNAGKNSGGEIFLLQPTAADVKCASDLIAAMVNSNSTIPLVEPILIVTGKQIGRAHV